MDQPPVTRSVDCRGLKCPMPIVKVAEAVKGLSPGSLLQVLASDPAFKADLQAWVKVTGNELVALESGPDGQRATVRKR